MRHRAIVLVLALVPSPVFGQQLARQVEDVRDGTVHLSYASRPGLCGDGRDMIRNGKSYTVLPSMQGYGSRGDTDFCVAGPVRVAIGRRDGESFSFRVHVGGRWSAGDDVTDLGTVSAEAAGRYLFDEALRANGNNSQYALAGAVFADSIDLVPDLLRLARTRDARSELRQRAIFWIGTYDDDRATRALRDVAADDGLDDDIRGAAIIALGRDDIADDDVSWLRALYPKVSSKLRDDIFLAVSRSDSPQASRWLSGVVTSHDETEHSREQALFWMGQGRGPTADLVKLYDRIDQPSLRSHYAFVISQRRDREAIDKLIDMAEHDQDRQVRHQALFWLGQSKDPRALAFIRDLVTK